MKILIVCSKNSGRVAPFIQEQADALMRYGLKLDFFFILSKGFMGYFKHRRDLLKRIVQFKPDLIHAHYGLSGLFANFQRSIPVITTFHGSDVNNKLIRPFSWFASRLSTANIFVSKEMLQLMPAPNSYIVPCGVDMELFRPKSQFEARKELGLKPDKKYILFSSSFDNKVKNYPLAQSAVSLLTIANIELLELKGFSRIQVSLLMNAADMMLMTSFTEGSPQFIKEAMACNRPIVATDVGDIRWLLGNESGHFISRFEPGELSDKIKLALGYSRNNKNTKGRDRIIYLGLDSENVAKVIVGIYKKCVDKNEDSQK